MRRVLAVVIPAFVLAGPASACSEDPTNPPPIPQLNAALDELLPTVTLSPEERGRVEGMRAEAAGLAAQGNEQAARAVEEQAMKLLGIDKVWLACGPGTFMWMRPPRR